MVGFVWTNMSLGRYPHPNLRLHCDSGMHTALNSECCFALPWTMTSKVWSGLFVQGTGNRDVIEEDEPERLLSRTSKRLRTGCQTGTSETCESRIQWIGPVLSNLRRELELDLTFQLLQDRG